MKKVSVIIPTIQKNLELLNNLVKTLNNDNFVTEIIIVDNSTKGYTYESDKVRVIVPKKNLFVNPSWNLGVKEAKEDIVALLNDDITIPENFCRNVVLQMHEKMGVIGFHRDYVINIPEIKPTPVSTDIVLEKATGRCSYFGVAMFLYKTSYFEIPEDIKIYWGDDWLYFQNEKRKRENYYITKQEIYHYGSLSSTDKIVTPYSKKDSKLYRKYTRKWWQQIFNIEPAYKGFRLTILGIELLHHYDKNH